MSLDTRMGVVRISFDLLHDMLHLPGEVDIVATEASPFNARSFCVKLHGPGLPWVVEGGILPEVELEVNFDYDTETYNTQFILPEKSP